MEMVDEDVAIYEALRDHPEFRNFPLPASWFAKFNIPALEIQTTKEYLNSRYTVKCALAEKDLPPLDICVPQDGGRLCVVPVEEPIKVETIQRPFVHPDGFLATLPSLQDESDIVKRAENGIELTTASDK
jgi:hypothetical protein